MILPTLKAEREREREKEREREREREREGEREREKKSVERVMGWKTVDRTEEVISDYECIFR